MEESPHLNCSVLRVKTYDFVDFGLSTQYAFACGQVTLYILCFYPMNHFVFRYSHEDHSFGHLNAPRSPFFPEGPHQFVNCVSLWDCTANLVNQPKLGRSSLGWPDECDVLYFVNCKGGG